MYKNVQYQFVQKKIVIIIAKRRHLKKHKLSLCLNQGSAGSWCSRAKFKVSKRFAGRSFSFSDLYKTFWF